MTESHILHTHSADDLQIAVAEPEGTEVMEPYLLISMRTASDTPTGCRVAMTLPVERIHERIEAIIAALRSAERDMMSRVADHHKRLS